MPSIFRPSSAGASSKFHWSWLTLAGPDARDFLHRLTTVNARELEASAGSPGFFLTPQGRVRAYFHLWNYGPDEFGFEFDAGAGGEWKEELLKAIDQFTFAEKMTLTDVTALDSIWIFDWADAPVEAGRTAALEDGVRICHHGARDFGRPWVTAWGTPERLGAWIAERFAQAPEVDAKTIEGWRVSALRPWIGREITANVNPLEAGLADGIAENKGCYPGQEVIEKIISLGAPARRLAKLEGDGAAPEAGTKLYNLAEPPVEVGEVTSAAATAAGSFAALGIVKKIHAKEGNEVKLGGANGSVARIVSLA